MKPDTIQLAHGGGGRMSRDLIDREIVPRFGRGYLRGLPDAALLPGAKRLVFATDSFVVRPLEFPGGNIGHLAVHGTVNDIAVSGGVPKWLSLGLILEEGLPRTTLATILDAIKAAADDCGVAVVTGDTKVVARGQCDGAYINTAGIGEALPGFDLGRHTIREDDVVICNGPFGDHGAAVLTAREGIDIENGPASDTGPVHRLVLAAAGVAGDVRFMRDPTRGGVAAVANEIVENGDFGILLREVDIPLSTGTKAVSELLGLDPLHLPSEGRLIAVVSPDSASTLLAKWREHAEGAGATQIGVVSPDRGRVLLDDDRRQETGRYAGRRASAKDLLMHELSIAQAVIEQVERILLEEDGRRVTQITLEVGTLSGIDPEALSMAFPFAAGDSNAEGSELIVNTVAARSSCAGCGKETEIAYPYAVCSECGSTNVEMCAGHELTIRSIQISK